MSLGQAPQSEDVFRSGSQFCRQRLAPISIYELLYRENHRLFPDEDFADLFAKIGRDSVPPRIEAVAMVLQSLEQIGDSQSGTVAEARNRALNRQTCYEPQSRSLGTGTTVVANLNQYAAKRRICGACA